MRKIYVLVSALRRSVSFYRSLENLNVAGRAISEQHSHSEKVAHTGTGISIEFRAIHRHPFVGDGFPVPPEFADAYEAGRETRPLRCYTVGPPNSQFFCLP